MLVCPNDATMLQPVTIEGIPVDQCPACSGYWLQRGELEALGEHHHKHLQPVTIGNVGVIESTRKCPQDGVFMRQHEFLDHTGLKIDQCPTCQGIWLDKDELTNTINYLETEPQNPTLTHQIMLFLYQLTAHPPVI